MQKTFEIIAGIIILIFISVVLWQIIDRNSTEKITSSVQVGYVSEQLPPDPGDASLANLEGIDANQNGVRDDVEIAIFNLHKDSLENREILMAGSAALQSTISYFISKTSQDSDSTSEALAKFAYCLSENSEMDRTKEMAILKSLVINTVDREVAYESYKQSRNGTVQQVVEASIEECRSLQID